MELMKPRMGRNVALVLLPASDSRKVVAAATGVVKVSYSSVQVQYMLGCNARTNSRGIHTDGNTDVINRIALPELAAVLVE
jgi:hypothetical protein